jgi:hypothetical protein
LTTTSLRKCDKREIVVVDKDVVMRWATSAKESSVTQEEKVESNWVDNVGIDNRPRWAIPASVPITCRLWEETNAMPLANDDQGNFRLNTQFFACTYGEVLE